VTTAAPDTRLEERAADDLADLLKRSNRFEVVDSATLAQILQREGSADMIEPGRLVRTVDVKGIDYIVFARIDEFSIEKSAQSAGAFRKLANLADATGEQVVAKVICNPTILFVEPATGDIVISESSRFEVTRPAVEMGLDTAASTSARNPLAATQPAAPVTYPITAADRRQVIKLAMDDAINRSLAKIDRFLQSESTKAASSTTAQSVTAAPAANPLAAPQVPVPATAPANPLGKPPVIEVPSAPAAARKVCDVCGTANDATARYCSRCGAKLSS
jgi:hypothetical protein